MLVHHHALPCAPQVGVLSGLDPIWGLLYDCSMFVGVAVGSVVYCLLMKYGGSTSSEPSGSKEGGQGPIPEGAGPQ